MPKDFLDEWRGHSTSRTQTADSVADNTEDGFIRYQTRYLQKCEDSCYSPKQFGQLIGRGRSVRTLQKLDRDGLLKAHRSPTNRRYYTQEQYLAYRGLTTAPSGKTIVYTRVSSAGQKADLSTQVARLRAYCVKEQYQPEEWIEEIGSGLDYRRYQFYRVLEEIELGQVCCLIIAHQDRFVRFGFECFATFCGRHGTEVIIVNGDTLSPEHE